MSEFFAPVKVVFSIMKVEKRKRGVNENDA